MTHKLYGGGRDVGEYQKVKTFQRKGEKYNTCLDYYASSMAVHAVMQHNDTFEFQFWEEVDKTLQWPSGTAIVINCSITFLEICVTRIEVQFKVLLMRLRKRLS